MSVAIYPNPQDFNLLTKQTQYPRKPVTITYYTVIYHRLIISPNIQDTEVITGNWITRLSGNRNQSTLPASYCSVKIRLAKKAKKKKKKSLKREQKGKQNEWRYRYSTPIESREWARGMHDVTRLFETPYQPTLPSPYFFFYLSLFTADIIIIPAHFFFYSLFFFPSVFAHHRSVH